MPEFRWRVDGFYDAGRLRIRPALLSAEQLPSELQKKVDSKTLGDDEAVLLKAVERGLFVAISSFLPLESLEVIRRNNLGFPRWRGNGNLPTSFEVRSSALRALGMEG